MNLDDDHSDTRVLIVEDEADTCLLMMSYLEKQGVEVSAVHTIKDALHVLPRFNPSIIFLDNNLPDGQAWQYLATIISHAPEARIFLMSAYETSDDSVILKNRRVHRLEKPISFSMLGELI